MDSSWPQEIAAEREAQAICRAARGQEDTARGFIFEGQRWPLWNPQRDIFKPRNALPPGQPHRLPGEGGASGTATNAEYTSRSSPGKRSLITPYGQGSGHPGQRMAR